MADQNFRVKRGLEVGVGKTILYADPGGNVSIGTTAIDARLTVDVGTAVTAFVVDGSEGQLFSVTNNLTSGSIFSVNDVFGVPSIDVDADGRVQLAPFGSNEYVGVGKTNPQAKLDVVGDTLISGSVGIGTDNPGQILHIVGIGNPVILLEDGSGTDQTFTRYKSSAHDWSVGADHQDGSFVINKSTNLRTGTPELYISSTGNVGIGTDDPGRVLHVKSSGSSVVSDFECDSTFFTSIDLTNTGGYARITSLNNDILLSPAGSEKVRITTAGDVGIGTDNPGFDFHLFRTGDTTLVIESDRPNADENANPKLIFRQDGGVNASAIGMNFDSDGTGNDLFIANSITSGSIRFLTGNSNGYTNAQERLRITPGGNVGIGTDSPVAFVDIRASNDPTTQGNILAVRNSGAASYSAALAASSSGGALIARGNATVQGEMHFASVDGSYANYTDRMRLNSSGDLLIGGTLPSVPNIELNADGSALFRNDVTVSNGSHIGTGTVDTIDTSFLTIGGGGAAANNRGAYIELYGNENAEIGNVSITAGKGGASAATAGSVILRTGAGTATERMRIDSLGNVGIGTDLPQTKLQVIGEVTATDYNSTSDARLKTNVRVIEDPLEKVLQINGVSFNWIKDNKPSMGVIADELEEVLPELVNNIDPKTVNYNGLIGLLIEVVKEQQSQINDLNNRLSKLE